MSTFDALKGKWIHAAPWDSDDYLAEYEVDGDERTPIVRARDLSDGEAFVISDVDWRDGVLSFVSLMPSTGRRGSNRFRPGAAGRLESEFTFTVVEEMKRAE